MKALCHFASPLLGSRVIRRTEGLEVIKTPDGFIVVNDYPGGAIGLRFNQDGLQVDRDGNVLSDPFYWLE